MRDLPYRGCRYLLLKLTTLRIDPVNILAIDIGWPAVGTIQSGSGSLSFAVRRVQITLLTRLTAHPLTTQRLSCDRPPFERSLQTRLTAHPHSTQGLSSDRPPFEWSLQTRLTAHPHTTQRLSCDHPPFERNLQT